MSANGVFNEALGFTFFGGGYSTIEGEANNVLELTFSSDVFNPIAAELNQTISFDVVAGVETPTVYGEASVSIDFSLNQSGRIVFGRQGYGTSANNEINFTTDGLGLVTVSGVATPTFEILFDGRMAQFSLGQSTAAFALALNSNVVNYTLLNKSRTGKNSFELTRHKSNEIRIRTGPNGVIIRKPGTNYAEIR